MSDLAWPRTDVEVLPRLGIDSSEDYIPVLLNFGPPDRYLEEFYDSYPLGLLSLQG